MLFSQQGHLTLAHTDSAIAGLRVRAEVNQLCGVDSRLIGRDEIARLVPALDLSDRPRYPILAALYHPPGGIIRHDAVVWGYARGADRLGVHDPSVTPRSPASTSPDGEVTGVRTTRGDIRTGTVVNATAGWCSTIAQMVGLSLPIITHPLQALVTEPLKPFLDQVLVSATLHVYVSQTDRGECVIGSEIDPYTSRTASARRCRSWSRRPTTRWSCSPACEHVRVLRQWAGICDMTPDYSPIMGEVPGSAASSSTWAGARTASRPAPSPAGASPS